MILRPDETARFYRVWLALLRYVNDRLQTIDDFPADPDADGINVPVALTPQQVFPLRNALWADDALRERFIADNPANLAAADLALVESWRYRLAGTFYVERYLKRYTVFLDDKQPAHAYGVLGLVSPIDDIIGPDVPRAVRTVLLPFEGRIIYDSLLAPYNVFFGPGYRASMRDAYRDAQEREGVITTLTPLETDEDPGAERDAIGARNKRVLDAFRKDLARSGLNPKILDGHVAAIASFAADYLLAQDPPRGLLSFTPDDLEDYFAGPGPGEKANRVSFRRFVRFLWTTGRLDLDRGEALTEFVKYA